MTEPEQRLALAKWCGWTHIEDRSESLMMAKGTYVYGYPPEGAIVGKKKELPDYAHDLNAVHSAEAKLDRREPSGGQSQCEDYSLMLLRSVGFHTPNDWGSVCHADFFRIAHATAAQRCEALLRCLGLFTE